MADQTEGSGAGQQAARRVSSPTARERAERIRSRRVQAPATDIYEIEEGLVILMDLPGVGSDAAEVTLEQSVLTIRAHTDEITPPGFSLVHQEYQTGDFERSFTLSEGIDAERIEAQSKDGVLRLFLPKTAPARARRIAVQAS